MITTPGTLASGRLDDTASHDLYTVPDGNTIAGLKLVMVNVDAVDDTVAKITVTRAGQTARRFPQAQIQEDGGSARFWLGDLSEGDKVSAQLATAADVDWTLTGGLTE